MEWERDLPPATEEFITFGEGAKRANDSPSTLYRQRKPPTSPSRRWARSIGGRSLRAYYVSLASNGSSGHDQRQYLRRAL